MDAVHPRWSSWSFLVYAGGLATAITAAGWLSYLSGKTGDGVDLLWALLVFAILLAVAEGFGRTDHPVTAGVFAFGAVGAFAESLGALATWFGWNAEVGIGGFHAGRILIELLWVAAAVIALRRFRFPLLVAQLVFASWLLVADVLSGGGTWTAIVTLVAGFSALAAAAMLDAIGQRAYAFWVHVGAGLMIGGAALWCVRHGGDVSWALIVVAGIGYVWIARTLRRSSWAVLGAIGIFIAATHFALKWERIPLLFFHAGSGTRPWAGLLVYTAASALLVALGLWVSRRPETG